MSAILKQLGLGRTYLARISVRVISGTGKAIVWGVLTDPKSGDQTFIPAQR